MFRVISSGKKKSKEKAIQEIRKPGITTRQMGREGEHWEKFTLPKSISKHICQCITISISITLAKRVQQNDCLE